MVQSFNCPTIFHSEVLIDKDCPANSLPVIGYGNEKGGVERRAEAKFGKCAVNWRVLLTLSSISFLLMTFDWPLTSQVRICNSEFITSLFPECSRAEISRFHGACGFGSKPFFRILNATVLLSASKLVFDFFN
jgi:hypothetical protein